MAVTTGNGRDETGRIFRAFLLGGIVAVMTTGCLLGAIALLAIGLHKSYLAGGWAPFILAHANSQLYGWVGLFVIGFALRQHPPRPGSARLFRTLAYLSLGLIAAAIPLRFLAEPLADQHGGAWTGAGIVSGCMEALAVILFAANIGMTRQRKTDQDSGAASGLPWQGRFIYASVGWWLLVAIGEPMMFALSHQPDRITSILFVAKWFGPFRDIQFLGFAANMIFGMSLSRFSTDFGAAPANRELGSSAFATWNVGLILRCAGWILYFNSGMTQGQIWSEVAGGALMMIGAVQVALAAGIYGRFSRKSAAHPFLRAAYGWLILAGLLWLLEPYHLNRIGVPFSHAYAGAIRHAITVGFISQMIVGVSLGVVSQLTAAERTGPGRLWWVFWLLNIGNGLRVLGQVGTDYAPSLFSPLGFTGFIELFALGIWAVTLIRLLARHAAIRVNHTPPLTASP